MSEHINTNNSLHKEEKIIKKIDITNITYNRDELLSPKMNMVLNFLIFLGIFSLIQALYIIGAFFGLSLAIVTLFIIMTVKKSLEREFPQVKSGKITAIFIISIISIVINALIALILSIAWMVSI